MPYDTRTFSIGDPRDFDGNPYEVADRAVAQLGGLLTLAAEAYEAAALMARNAELDRQIIAGQDPDPEGWLLTPSGMRWLGVKKAIDTCVRDLHILRQVAAYDPKARY